DAAGTALRAARYNILFKSRPLVIFGLFVMLFHLANAALLPLAGQKLAAAYPKEATAMMSSCIVAQMVKLPIALLVGRTADTWGRKRIKGLCGAKPPQKPRWTNAVRWEAIER
ncbi:MAG TPA: hypothetical protein VK822_19170, partial [Acetobacteraceae bacterium]|nr:hypothetical protein [Acetobacteraceae bacterium]